MVSVIFSTLSSPPQSGIQPSIIYPGKGLILNINSPLTTSYYKLITQYS